MTDFDIDNIKSGKNKNEPTGKKNREKKVIHEYAGVKDYHSTAKRQQELEIRKAVKDLGGDKERDPQKLKNMLRGIINADIKIPRSYYEKTFKEKL